MSNPQKPKSAFRRWKRRMLDGTFRVLGAPVLGGLFHLLARTLRLHYVGYEHFEAALKSGRPVVIAFLHEDLMSIFLGHLKVHPCPIGVMLSQSRDGEMVAQIIQRYELVPIRASSSRGAVRGFLELYRWLKTKRDFPTVGTLAVDGPRGPRRVAKAGGCMLARKAEALLLPVAFNYSRKIVTKSWDGHLIPYPFAKMMAHFAPAIDTAELPDDDAANARQLTEVLIKLKTEAGLP